MRPRPFHALTPRELQVAMMVVDGRTSAEIAKTLGMSARTCEVHRLRILRKTGARNAVELARAAVRDAIVSVHWDETRVTGAQSAVSAVPIGTPSPVHGSGPTCA